MSDTDRRHPNVASVSEIGDGYERTNGRFALSIKRLGAATGGAGIGCCWTEVPPGCTAFPAHYHTSNEESLYVLEGRGTLRIGADEVEVSAGDYATFPVGPDYAHQLLNTGDGPLRYLCFSTLLPVDVVGYPDSGKIAAIAANPEADWENAWVKKWFPGDADVGYFEGEDTGE